MKHIGNIKYADGAKKNKKRIARGPGSGHGGTSTRGHKGQKSRSGAKVRIGFEGGQMPINRRLPKFGFTNRFRKDIQIVNLSKLQELIDNNIIDSVVNPEILFSNGVIKKIDVPVKILGEGELNKALDISAHLFSKSAKDKIESAGGKVTVNE
ncbi:MAG TPA: 50S ribosomal protein L15 [Candidatus Kapabacteria bacterium]|nr:50S ribosomal protein L15 [Candidatus Kapabacteria bacterium]